MSRPRSNTDELLAVMDSYKKLKEDDTPAREHDGQDNDDAAYAQSTHTEPEEFHSMMLDWGTLFCGKNCSDKIRQLGLKGQLRESCFRSVCWKLFFDILSEDRESWVSEIQQHRKNYQEVRQKYLVDPRESSKADIAVYDPLSLDSDSPWNRFFQDEELRQTICRDVERTFPAMEYFQEEWIQTMMTDILFCYARQHPELSYRQGMHELLATIVRVVDADKRHSSGVTCSSEDDWIDEMVIILDSKEVEADSFTLFSALMETCSIWYQTDNTGRKPAVNKSSSTDPQRLFAGDSTRMSSAIAKKLERIQHSMLKKEDHELYTHLQKLEITPQMYGLRWIRLLFTEELPLDNVLLLWDAIFAFSPTLDLVEYIFLSMLLLIRDPLLASNYGDAVKLLLNYPPVPDAHFLVERALFLRSPKTYPRPRNWQLMSSNDRQHNTVLPVSSHRAVKSITQGARSIAGKVSSGTKGRLKRPAASAKSPPLVSLTTSDPAIGSSTPPVSRPMSPPSTRFQRLRSSSSHHQQPVISPAEPASDENSFRASVGVTSLEPIEMGASPQVRKIISSCNHCSTQMGQYLDTLQEEIMKIELPSESEDKILLAIAGLKQVRDFLRGTLGLDCMQDETCQSAESLDAATVLSSSGNTTDAHKDTTNS